MMYGDKEIDNAIIIKGMLCIPVSTTSPTCDNCALRLYHCNAVCKVFEEGWKWVILKRLNGGQFYKLHEDETKR